MPEWSEYQLEVFRFVREETGHAVVEAVAGSGKTTTLMASLKYLRPRTSSLLMAFNKHIAEELKRRVPWGVRAATSHSQGNWALTREFGRLDLDKYKMRGILREMEKDKTRKPKLEKGAYSQVRDIIDKAKAWAVSDFESIRLMCKKYEYDFPGAIEEYIISWVVPAMEISRNIREHKVIDFNDMVYLALELTTPPTYDTVFVDEMQDFNFCQLAFAQKSLRKGGRIIGLGDRYQSIYGFRGADSQAIPRIIRELNAKPLPLSISYRCAGFILDLARTVVPHIQERPDAPEGLVDVVEYYDFYDNVAPGDMVLCRTNAPLVETCLMLIREGRKASIPKRTDELPEELKDIIKACSADTGKGIISELVKVRDEEIQRLTEKNLTKSALALEDKINTAIALAVDMNTKADIIRRIDDIFNDSEEGVLFYTVHRAKGLESKRVWILRSDLIPHPKADDLEQETNLKYVAVTRAMEELYIVLPEWARKDDKLLRGDLVEDFSQLFDYAGPAGV